MTTTKIGVDLRELDQPTILILDHDDDVLDHLGELLSRSGYHALQVNCTSLSAEVMADVVHDLGPDLVLLGDRGEPGRRSGWEALATIHERVREVPLLMLRVSEQVLRQLGKLPKGLQLRDAPRDPVALDDVVRKIDWALAARSQHLRLLPVPSQPASISGEWSIR